MVVVVVVVVGVGGGMMEVISDVCTSMVTDSVTPNHRERERERRGGGRERDRLTNRPRDTE